MLIESCKEGFAREPIKVVRNALPDDAKFHHAFFDPNVPGVFLVIQSEAFAEVCEGGAIPALPVPEIMRA